MNREDRICRRVRGAAIVLLLCCVIAEGAASPPPAQADVSGTWDAHFSGTVRGTGTSQTDDFVLELRQEGATVTGVLRVPGHGLEVALTGEVEGGAFRYTARGSLGPDCEVGVSGETTVEPTGGRLSGTQTQSTCEGTAVGKVTAVRRR